MFQSSADQGACMCGATLVHKRGGVSKWKKNQFFSLIISEHGANLPLTKAEQWFATSFFPSAFLYVAKLKREERKEYIRSNYPFLLEEEDSISACIENLLSINYSVSFQLFPNKYFTEFLSYSADERLTMIKADNILNGCIDIEARNLNLDQSKQQWYLNFAKCVVAGAEQQGETYTKKISFKNQLDLLMDDALDFFTPPKEVDMQKLKFLKGTDLNTLGTLKEIKFVQFKKIFNEHDNSDLVRGNVIVPVDSKNQLAKDILPFLPKFQVDLFSTEERETLNQNINSGSTVVIIGPSGLGKTALIARRLGVNPGLFITCTSSLDASVLNGRGIDYASLALFMHCEKLSNIELYASVRQLIECNFIARLLVSQACLENQTLLDYFETPLQLISYIQWNGNTNMATSIFKDMIEQGWQYLPINSLRKITVNLIVDLYTKLELSHDIPFVIAVDEASIFSKSSTVMLSAQGTPRDLLTAIASEISSLQIEMIEKNLTISDMYCGTFFTSDVVDIIQSSVCKLTERNMKYSIGLDLVSFDQALQMLEPFYNIREILKKQKVSKNLLKVKLFAMFPTRRRVIGMIIANPSLILENVENAFKLAWRTFTQTLSSLVSEGFTTKTSKDTIDAAFLLEALVKHDYPIFAGKLIKCDLTISSMLTGSGIARPVCELDCH
ncbi:predicted protein [Naegleria gruberi]|uniref:Predicted protein n=1 Tax=Naegleria gruberi TaxID=5762 RepID=D2V0T7_NAEGR|nr:uncharacterized protein NAEGRDRAFT_62411 [Naegleria gruberi]EFC49787.1 predicted protein [Naegleria gruberi]|eukprot:XP_002682531.1 predicted protein [Naegleria gruberi strain NEG-M]